MSDQTPKKMVLRTVFLPPAVDSKLRLKAFEQNISKNELIRQYISKAVDEENPPAP